MLWAWEEFCEWEEGVLSVWEEFWALEEVRLPVSEEICELEGDIVSVWGEFYEWVEEIR